MKVYILSFSLLFLILGLAAQGITNTPYEFDDDTPLWEVMTKLGKIRPNGVDNQRQHSVDKGRELVNFGYTADFKDRKTAKIGNLPCAVCHSLMPEHDDLSIIDPQKRLMYADSFQLPFLPGSPLYGMVNRVYFFNGDYQTTYKNEEFIDLVKKGHSDLRTAIQACNSIFADGRTLEEWEIESILAYLWTLQIRMKDLKFEDQDLKDIQFALDNNTGNAKAVNLLRRAYVEVYPANLSVPQPIAERKKTSPIINNFANGKRVYERSCLHCHADKKHASPRFDLNQSTFQFLKKHFDDTTSRYSIYEALRYLPTPSRAHRNSRSPHFSKQRLADQQIQDLRFFIIQMAQFGDEAYEYYKNQRIKAN
jgi:mono/diheme cytochrome c family protein